jgi:hypothetical protein
VPQLNRPDISLQGSGRSKPYYGNYVQLKCNRPDARVTPSKCGLVMEAFSAILERQLQLIPSGCSVKPSGHPPIF